MVCLRGRDTRSPALSLLFRVCRLAPIPDLEKCLDWSCSFLVTAEQVRAFVCWSNACEFSTVNLRGDLKCPSQFISYPITLKTVSLAKVSDILDEVKRPAPKTLADYSRLVGLLEALIDQGHHTTAY
jgi:adenosine deaminase